MFSQFNITVHHSISGGYVKKIIMNIKKILNLNYYVFAICFVGCIYQLYRVSSQYTAYNVLLQFEIKNPEYISFPDLSYCVSNEGAFNFTRFYSRHSALVEQFVKYGAKYQRFRYFDKKTFKKDKFTLNEFMTNINLNISINQWPDLMYTFEEVMELAYVVDPNLLVNNREPVPFRKRLSIKSPNDVCYTMQFIPNLTYHYNELMVRAAYSGNIAGIKIDVDLTSLGLTKQVMFHMKGTQPRGLIHSYFIKDSNVSHHNGYDISFHRFITELLPDPYTTGCMDYSALGFENRDHAFDDCTYKLSIRKTESLCCHALIDLNEEIIVKNFTSTNDCSKEKLEIEHHVLAECEKRYPKPNCYTVRMIPVEKKAFVIEDESDYRFFIYAPLDHDFVTSTYPYMRLLDYLIYTGSAIGFWFGISLLKFMNDAKHVVANVAVFINKKKEGFVTVIQNQNIAIISQQVKLETNVKRIKRPNN